MLFGSGYQYFGERYILHVQNISHHCLSPSTFLAEVYWQICSRDSQPQGRDLHFGHKRCFTSLLWCCTCWYCLGHANHVVWVLVVDIKTSANQFYTTGSQLSKLVQLWPKFGELFVVFPIPFRLIKSGILNILQGRDSSVGIATRYGLDGPGIESRWKQDFPHPSRPALGLTQPPVQWVPGLSRG